MAIGGGTAPGRPAPSPHDDARVWRLRGFTAPAARSWRQAGFRVADAVAWATACADVGRLLLGAWDAPGSTALAGEASVAADWWSYGTTPDEMVAFRLQGFEGVEAAGWLMERFSAADAAAWHRSGAAAPDARELVDAGFGPDDAARLNALDRFDVDD
jgi:hypothetical protein